jgi:5-formyltetrahydrofolate cyclo-ligase
VQNCASPPRAESLTCCSPSHLLLWFESNDSHRHRRVTSSHAPLSAVRKQLRSQLRARRRAVTPAERANSARAVAHHADAWLHLRPGWRIAVYASLPQELDTAPLIELAQARGCAVYLPRIDRHAHGRRMRFIRMQGRQRSNRHGISEPTGAQAIGARWLDLVFVPLVGFDARGVRLGMGGGYYDRAFAFRRWRTAWHAPLLVGLAYSFQQLEALETASHDVLLDAVVTEQGVRLCTTG